MQNRIRRDSRAWHLQVWISFAAAGFLSGVGLAYLPGTDLDRAFMIMGYLFCLTTAFVLAKLVRDNEQAQEADSIAGARGDTPLFKYLVWAGFFLAMALTAWGLMRMQISDTYKAFLGVSWLYLITCAFTLAKLLRDQQEVARAERNHGAQ
jgi:hypothetical protein